MGSVSSCHIFARNSLFLGFYFTILTLSMMLLYLLSRLMSLQSDVWSYGVVLWELFSLARSPYPGIEPGELVRRLEAGYRMERPRWASPDLYNEMRACWSSEPGERPTFTELAARMSELLSAGAREQYLELSSVMEQEQEQEQEQAGPDTSRTLPKDFRLGPGDDRKPLQRQTTVSNPGYKCSFNS